MLLGQIVPELAHHSCRDGGRFFVIFFGDFDQCGPGVESFQQQDTSLIVRFKQARHALSIAQP